MIESKSDLQVWKHFSKKKRQNPDGVTSGYQNVIIWQKRKLVPYPMRLLISDRTEKMKRVNSLNLEIHQHKTLRKGKYSN